MVGKAGMVTNSGFWVNDSIKYWQRGNKESNLS